MKLYSPLTGDFYEKEIDEDGWVNTAEEPILFSGGDLAQYREDVEEVLKGYGRENLMEYFDAQRNPGVKEKAVSAVPSVEIRGRELWGCTTVKLKSPLTDAEMKDFQEYLTGQYADGWGEGFEQREIEVDGGILCVHFWNPDSFAFERDLLEPQEKMPEISHQVRRPKMRLYGEDGNIFAILGKATRLLRENGQSKQAGEMMDRVCHSDDYNKALRIISEYVETELTPSVVQKTEHRKKRSDPER